MANQIIEIALACIISAGGIGGIIVAVVKFSAGKISDRLFEKYKAELNRQTEKYKTELSKKEYVSKTRFDAEFTIYRELCKNMSDFLQDVFTLMPVSKDELLDKSFPDYKTLVDGAAGREMYHHALSASLMVKATLTANRPFIEEEIEQRVSSILDLTKKQLVRYWDIIKTLPDESETRNDEDYALSMAIWKEWKIICASIRQRISCLEIIP